MSTTICFFLEQKNFFFLQEIATRHFRGQENRQTILRIVRIIGQNKSFLFRALSKAIMKMHKNEIFVVSFLKIFFLKNV